MSQHKAISTVVLEGESLQQFEELVNALARHHRPANTAERGLINHMAAARWRQMRAWNIMRKALDTGLPAGPKVLRLEAQNRREFNSARGELKFLQDHRATLAGNCAEKNEIFQFEPNPKNGHSPTRTSQTATSTAEAR